MAENGISLDLVKGWHTIDPMNPIHSWQEMGVVHVLHDDSWSTVYVCTGCPLERRERRSDGNVLS